MCGTELAEACTLQLIEIVLINFQVNILHRTICQKIIIWFYFQKCRLNMNI